MRFGIKRAVLMLLATVLCAAALNSIAQRAPPAPTHVISDKPPNSRIVTEPNGQRVAEIRWRPANAGPVGILRVPANYIWRGGGLATGAFGPDYPDPNVVQSSTYNFILEALLPTFEPFTPQNANRFKDGITGSTITIMITRAPVIGRGGIPLVELTFRSALQMLQGGANDKLYHIRYAEKSDRFGLKRYGAFGDFEQFRRFGAVNDLYFPDREFKDVFLLCGAEEIHDALEDPSWTARPICQHTYHSSVLGGLVQLSYRRIWLKDWRDVQAGVDRLFHSFTFTALEDTNDRAHQQ